MSAMADEAPPPDTPVQSTLPTDDTVAPPAGDALIADPPVAESPAEEPPVAEPPAEEPPVAEPPAEEPPVADPPVEEAPAPDPTAQAPQGAAPLSANSPAGISASDVPPVDDQSPQWSAVDIPAPSAQRFSTLSTVEYDPSTANPGLQEVCGLDFGLVLDKSGSIGTDGIGNLKDAADAFTSALVDTGSQVSVVDFDTESHLLIGATDLTDANLGSIQDSYAGLDSDGWTNWEGGLEESANTFPGFTDGVELMIVITDGNPNTTNASFGGEFSDGSPEAVNPAIAIANSVKTAGTHVFVVAVGDNVDLAPIEAISGSESFDGTNFSTADYMTTQDYSTLAASLAQISQALCGGTVKIHKSVDGVDAEGWSFASSTSDVAPTSADTGANGWTDPFAVEGYGDQDSRDVTFTEEDRTDFTLNGVECFAGQVGLVIDHVDGSLSWTVPVAKNAIVDCYVSNSFTPPPKWDLRKTSSPVDGVVEPGDPIIYTLTAENTSAGPVVVTGATATDDLSGVLDFATLDESSLPAGLTFDPVTEKLTWAIPDMVLPGDWQSVDFTVVVNADTFGGLLHNKVIPGPGGECPVDIALTTAPAITTEPTDPDSCNTDHRVIDIDLVMAKTASDTPVDSDRGDLIDYTLTVTNAGQDPALAPVVTDLLPEGVTLSGTVDVATDPPGNDVGWTIDASTPGEITASYDSLFYPGDVATFTFQGLVGELAQPDPAVAVPDLVNEACVAGFRYADDMAPDLVAPSIASEMAMPELLPGWDSDPSNDCADASTPVKSITLDAQSQCLNDTPWFHYAVAPYNIGDPAANPIALIWWTQAAFDARNPLIDAGDQAAILANGAAAVQYIAYPAGWSSGDVIEGSELWPGAAVDGQGNPTAWPGWTKKANGTWVIDPAAPFYQLRSGAVVEIRINPSTDASVVYPPATPNCNAAPDQPKPVTPAGLPSTGADPSGASLLAGLLILTGISAVAIARRRMLRGE